MRRTNKGQPIRPAATPQWGWSGVHRRQTRGTQSAEVAEIVRQLPRSRSSPESVVAEIEEYGDRFRGDLVQDEFGPRRAERAAALRRLLEAVEAVRLAIDSLGPAARQSVSEALAMDPETIGKTLADRLAAFESETEAFEAIGLAAADARPDFLSSGCEADLESIDRLRALSEEAALVRSLDTTTEMDLVLGSLTNREHEAEQPNDALAHITRAVCSFNERLREDLDRLSVLKGPDARLSLPLLVANLCRLWERETGQVVTANPYKKTAYDGAPQSEAGAFVSKVVAVLTPTPTELGTAMGELGRTSIPHLKSQLHWSPQAIHSAMRAYVASRGAKPTQLKEGA